jgi:drug/metabolite transporter (DMT)-like permease
MTLPISLVLLSGFFHALWNVLTKKSLHKESFLFSVQLLSFAAFFPIFFHNFLQINFTPTACALFLFSMLAHGFYFVILARLYTIGDLSQTYPIIRGSSLLIVPLFGVIILHEHLSWLGLIGVAMIISGIFTISEIKLSLLNRKIFSLSLLVGASIAAYVVIDRLALNHTDPITLNQIGTLGNILALLPFVLKEKSKNLRHEIKSNYKSILIGTFLAPASYMIFLYAISMAQISILAPMREIGTVFGAIIGIFFLHEPNAKSRIISSIIITVGVILLAAS